MRSAGPIESGAGQRPSVAVVPVAGHGTRLRPLSAYIPKELLPVGGRLALWRIAEELAYAGIQRIVFVVSPEKQTFVERCFTPAPSAGGAQPSTPFSDGPAALLTFQYVVQPTMRGLGDALLQSQDAVGMQPFVVALGDAVYEEEAPGQITGRLIDAFISENAALALAVQRVPRERLSRYGVVKPVRPLSVSDATIATLARQGEPTVGKDARDHFAIEDIVEKPAPEHAPSPFAAAARYVVQPEVFAALADTPPDPRGEVPFTGALQTLLRIGKKGIAVPLRDGEVRHDIGSLDTYFRAFVAFARHDPDQGRAFIAYLQQVAEETRSISGEHGREE